jgi:hypothetical protein
MPHPRPPQLRERAFNGAPDLSGALQSEGWRKAIRIENASADKLDALLKKRDMKKSASLSSLGSTAAPHVPMPTPPCTMSLMLSRLSTRESREIASRRSMALARGKMPSELLSTTTSYARLLATTSGLDQRPRGSVPWK